MGLTSCRWITIAKTLARRATQCSRHHAGCRVAVERAADRYTLICDGPNNTDLQQELPETHLPLVERCGPFCDGLF